MKKYSIVLISLFFFHFLQAQTNLNRGDLVILGLNTTITPSTQDEISFVCFKDITTGTKIQITDNGYEACTSGLWSEGEGGAELKRIGGTIKAGTVITFRTAYTIDNPIRFTFPDAEWIISDLVPNKVRASYFDLNSKGDQIYFAQDGIWTTIEGTNCTVSSSASGGGATTTEGNFPGNKGRILFGFSTSGKWKSFLFSTGESGLFPNMDCFSMELTGTTKYNKYVGLLTATTQTEWLSRINSSKNWLSINSTGTYFSTSPDLHNLIITILPSNPIPSPTWNAPFDTVCATTLPLNLSNYVTGTKGGNWSGRGVTLDGIFNPHEKNDTFNITYTINYYSGTNNCQLNQTHTITVSNKIPSIKISAMSSLCACKESHVIFVAKDSNSGFIPIYEWRKNGLPVGQNISIYQDTFQNNNDIILCKLTSSQSCASVTQVLSNALIENVKEATFSQTIKNVCPPATSYLFNDSNFSFSGIYMVHLFNHAGCDSFASLKLTINSNTSSITKLAICKGDSITFNGTNYRDSGTYIFHLINEAGCDSIATLVLTTKLSSASITKEAICIGDSFFFNGINYNVAGTYIVHLINDAGCDSLATLVLTTKLSSASITKEAICMDESMFFNGNNYTVAGTYNAHLINNAGCDSIATLVLTTKLSSASITKEAICMGESLLFNGYNYTIAGTYNAQLINDAGCDSIATLVLTTKLSSASITKEAICMGEAFFFNGINYTVAGTYNAHLINDAGCDSIAKLELTIKQPSASITNEAICMGESMFFNGNNYTVAGTYNAHLINNAGCDSIATLVLTTKFSSASITKEAICMGESLLFNGYNYTVAGTYNAQLINDAGCDSIATLVLSTKLSSASITKEAICMGGAFFFNGINYTVAGTYNAHLINDAGCDSIAKLELTIKQSSESITKEAICMGESLFFNGNNYTVAGIYNAHLTNDAGCDSIAKLELTIKQSSVSITKVAICMGESLFFNGNNYTVAGIYNAHLTNDAGCDSIAKLELTIKQSSASITKVAICMGESLFFNGINYMVAGIYNAHLTNDADCDSLATLLLTIKQHSASITKEAICIGDSLFFNGINYTVAGTYNAHLINDAGCDSIAYLVLTMKQPSASTTKEAICMGESFFFNGINYTVAGTYNAHLINDAGCDSIAYLVLTMKQPSASTTKEAICMGESLFFNGINYTVAGIYNAHLINKVGCDSLATLLLTIKQPSASKTKEAICIGDSLFFNGNNYTVAGTYNVHFINSEECDSIATLVLTLKQSSRSITKMTICNGSKLIFNGYSYSISGNYIVHLKNSVGCDSIANLDLTIKSSPETNITATICSSDSFYFNGKYYKTSGYYSFRLINSEGCDSITNLKLIVEKIKQVDPIVGVSTICKNESAILYNNTPDGKWSTNSSTYLSVDSIGIILGLNCGIGQIKYQVVHDCGILSAIKYITVSGLKPRNVYTKITASNCINPFAGIADIEVLGDESPYKFTFNDSIYFSHKTINNLINDAYQLLVYNNYNCLVDSIIVIIPMKTEGYCDTLFVPSGFMPNSQNVLSRLLKPFGNLSFISNYSFKVYNRYGSLVFKTKDLFSGWDGRVNGIQQEIGTYIWIIEYNQNSGIKKFQKGTSVLIL